MRLKTILLASVAGAALIAAQPAYAEGFYFSASGGANFIENTDGTFDGFFRGKNTVNANFDPDAGFLIASALGLELDRWLHGLKVELETSYRHNNVGGHWTITDTEVLIGALASGQIDGHMSTFALMSNAWYEFSVGSRFKPYLGGGVGWARSQFDGSFLVDPLTITALSVNPFQGFSVHASGFAYQLGAGVTSQIMPGVSLGLGYRYFDAPDTEIFFSGKLIPNAVGPAVSNSNSIKFDNVSHSVALTLSIDID